MRPLEAFRSDSRVRARVALGDRYGPTSEEIETPPDPEEITVETYADILEARQRIDAPPTTVWRFDPGA